MMECWPKWLTRHNNQTYGPNFSEPIPYPVFQQQQAVLSADNANQSSVSVADAYYQTASSRILLANLDTTIVHIMPNNAYDTINIVSFTSPVSAAGPPRLPGLGTPLFFSMDKPGRYRAETPLGGSQEAFMSDPTQTLAFDPADPSSYPTCIQLPNSYANLALNAQAGIYTNFSYATIKTNRPFYFWFGDGINTLPVAPVTHVNFKVSWFVQGR